MQKVAPQVLEGLTARAEKSVWVDTNEALAKLAAHWQTLPTLSIDTEFAKSDTFYAIPGLIQIADDRECYLLDPKAIDDFSPLVEVFENESIVKILHAPSEDLELFLHSYGAKPKPMFDTQIAAAFIGLGTSMGLVRLLAHYLDINLSKAETTSNWLRRPLSLSQEKYAALDVTYLQTIYEMQVSALEDAGMLEWAMQESQALVDQAGAEEGAYEHLHCKFSNLCHWPYPKQRALQQFLKWREEYARAENIPRPHVMRNDVLVEIINDWPTDFRQLAKHEAFARRIMRLEGSRFFKIFSEAKKQAPADDFYYIPNQADTVWRKQTTKKVKAFVRKKAEELGVAPELLLRNKDIDSIFFNKVFSRSEKHALPEKFPQWRRALIEEELLAFFVRKP